MCTWPPCSLARASLSYELAAMPLRYSRTRGKCAPHQSFEGQQDGATGAFSRRGQISKLPAAHLVDDSGGRLDLSKVETILPELLDLHGSRTLRSSAATMALPCSDAGRFHFSVSIILAPIIADARGVKDGWLRTSS